MADGPTLAEKFRITAQLADAGLAMKRQQLRRLHPEATEEQIGELLQTWLRRRPMDAPPGPVHRIA